MSNVILFVLLFIMHNEVTATLKTAAENISVLHRMIDADSSELVEATSTLTTRNPEEQIGKIPEQNENILSEFKGIHLPSQLPFVVTFVYRLKFPPAPVCSGTILTEKLILTAAYPIGIMPRNWYCALPGFSMLFNMTSTQIEQNCMGMKEILFMQNWTPDVSGVNVVIVELEESIVFNWYTSTGQIPFPDNPDKFDYKNASCSLAGWAYRNVIKGPGFPLEKIPVHLVVHVVTVHVTDGYYSYISPSTSGEGNYLCESDIGMPLICDCSIVGILALENVTGVMNCGYFKRFSYVNLLNGEVQQFLKAVIPNGFINPTGDVYEEIQPPEAQKDLSS